MLYNHNVAAKPVQISLDEELLEQVDADPETRASGRSAFVRSAIGQYLAVKRRHEIDARITTAYGGRADDLLADAAEFMDAQAWPDD